MADLDEKFYERADEYIHLANKQCADIGRGKVSASFMYAVARFNAWVSACGFTAENMGQKIWVREEFPLILAINPL